jgi:hypothetical protein
VGKFGSNHPPNIGETKTMKTLVIHPKDQTTDMLSLIYEGRDFTLIDDPETSKDKIRRAIECHDRIIMLGHGIPQGLINPKFMITRRFEDLLFIDDSFAYLLGTKETISVWCYSDEYFRRHRLSGFHTGMIISEVKEARFVLGYSPLTAKELDKNMHHFARVIGECIDMPSQEMKKYILANYVGDDEITRFNRSNILIL